MDARAPRDARTRTLILRFFTDPSGRLQVRVVDPERDRAWLVAEPVALRELVVEPPQRGEGRGR